VKASSKDELETEENQPIIPEHWLWQHCKWWQGSNF